MTSPSPTRRISKKIKEIMIRQDEFTESSIRNDYLKDQGESDNDDNDEKLKNLSIDKNNDDNDQNNNDNNPIDAEQVIMLDDLDIPKDERRRLHGKSHVFDNDEIISNEKINDYSKNNNKYDVDEVPLPGKKSQIEKYINSKIREGQVKHYNESFIKETREERAAHRAKIREREVNTQEEPDTDSIESSPSKKVRFRLQ